MPALQQPSKSGLAASQATIPTSPYKPAPIITQKFALSHKISKMETIPQILTIGKDCSDASLTHYKKIIEDLESYYDDSCKTAFEE